MTSILIDETASAIDSEEHAVQLWRREQFGSLGFDSVISRLLAELVTTAPPRDRALEAQRRRALAEKRFGHVSAAST